MGPSTIVLAAAAAHGHSRGARVLPSAFLVTRRRDLAALAAGSWAAPRLAEGFLPDVRACLLSPVGCVTAAWRTPALAEPRGSRRTKPPTAGSARARAEGLAPRRRESVRRRVAAVKAPSGPPSAQNGPHVAQEGARHDGRAHARCAATVRHLHRAAVRARSVTRRARGCTPLCLFRAPRRAYAARTLLLDAALCLACVPSCGPALLLRRQTPQHPGVSRARPLRQVSHRARRRGAHGPSVRKPFLGRPVGPAGYNHLSVRQQLRHAPAGARKPSAAPHAARPALCRTAQALCGRLRPASTLKFDALLCGSGAQVVMGTIGMYFTNALYDPTPHEEEQHGEAAALGGSATSYGATASAGGAPGDDTTVTLPPAAQAPLADDADHASGCATCVSVKLECACSSREHARRAAGRRWRS